MHLGNIKDSTNQSRADLFPLWSLEVPVTSLGFRGRGSVALPPGSFGQWWASHTQRPGSLERRPAAESRSAIGQRPLSSTGREDRGHAVTGSVSAA